MKFNRKVLTTIFIVVPWVFVTACLISIYKDPFTVIASSNGLNKDFNWSTYTDKLHNGNSEIRVIKEKTPFEYQYCLKDGYRYKFAIVGIAPKNSHNFDLSVYNQMDISIKSKIGKGILFYLYTEFPEGKKINHPSWPHQHIINTDTSYTNIRLALDQFYTPDWWYTEVNETKASLGPPFFKKTLAFGFGNCIQITANTPDTVSVKEMTFSVNLLPYFLKLLPYVLAYYLLLFSFYTIRKRKRKKVVFMQMSVPVSGNDQGEEESVFHFMGLHYFEPDYSIEELSKQTSLSETKINQIIKNKTGLTFKQFLNDLRITESERLLEHTDLPVNELAEKVGFKSREHFSRLFKSKTGLNPLEIRKKKENTIKYDD